MTAVASVDRLTAPVAQASASRPPVETAEPTPPPTRTTSETQRPVATEETHCGRQPGEPVQPAKWPFGNDRRCDRLETTWNNVLEMDLRCSLDADCVVFQSDGGCFSAPLNKQAYAKPEYKKGPCGNPASGACANTSATARCANHCCEVSSAR